MTIVHVSSLPPTRCGVAEYTASLSNAIEAAEPQTASFFVRLDYEASEPRFSRDCISIDPSNERAIEKAANALNQLAPQSILLQHEFKLYGGNDGDNVLRFLECVNAPVVTTLHTVSPSLSPNRQSILHEILRRSAWVVIFSETARSILTESYGFNSKNVLLTPHGVPDIPFIPPNTLELPGMPRRGVSFITCGLLRPAKGLEEAITAFALLRKVTSDFAYIICGADHPRNPDAKEYRRHLLDTVASHELEDHVHFVNRFLQLPEMIRAIQACNAGVFAYKSPEQSSSGALALTLACGRPVISTNFQYARAVVNPTNGMLVQGGDVDELAIAIGSFASNPSLHPQMALDSHTFTRHWVWREVAKRHLEVLNEVSKHS